MIDGERRRVWNNRVVAAATVFLLSALLGLIMLATAAWAAPSSSPDETVETNGRIFTILQVGNRIYLGGSFTQVDGVPRKNLAAINATTGKLIGWSPSVNRQVLTLAASPDRSRVYAGGTFTTVNGIPRPRLVAINATNGAVYKNWRPGADFAVRALVVKGARVYIGGDFRRVNGKKRLRLALVDSVSGKLNTRWKPLANGVVRTLASTAGGKRIYAGGGFTSISGVPRIGLAALNTTTGDPDKTWRSRPHGAVFDLQVSGRRLYAAEGGTGGAVSAYRAAGKGEKVWRRRTDGDVLSIAVLGGKVYAGGHFLTVSGQPRRFFAATAAATGSLDGQWKPSGGGGYVYTLTPDSARARIYAGGDFHSVSDQPRRGFAQFSDPAAP